MPVLRVRKCVDKVKPSEVVRGCYCGIETEAGEVREVYLRLLSGNFLNIEGAKTKDLLAMPNEVVLLEPYNLDFKRIVRMV